MAVESRDFDPVAHVADCAIENGVLVDGWINEDAMCLEADILFSGIGETRASRCLAAAVLHGLVRLLARRRYGRWTVGQFADMLVLMLQAEPRLLAQVAATYEPYVRKAVPSAFNRRGPLNRSDAIVFELLRRVGHGIDPTRVRDPREPFSIYDVAAIGD